MKNQGLALLCRRLMTRRTRNLNPRREISKWLPSWSRRAIIQPWSRLSISDYAHSRVIFIFQFFEIIGPTGGLWGGRATVPVLIVHVVRHTQITRAWKKRCLLYRPEQYAFFFFVFFYAACWWHTNWVFVILSRKKSAPSDKKKKKKKNAGLCWKLWKKQKKKQKKTRRRISAAKMPEQSRFNQKDLIERG